MKLETPFPPWTGRNVFSFVLVLRHGMNSFEVDDISKGSMCNGPQILLQEGLKYLNGYKLNCYKVLCLSPKLTVYSFVYCLLLEIAFLIFKLKKLKHLIFIEDNYFMRFSLLYIGLIYLFTPLSWCHNFGKEKYFTNRSRRTFCGIQTEDSKNLFSSTLLDFFLLSSNFTFLYFTFDLFYILDECLFLYNSTI